MDRNEIMGLLPHRQDMLLLDTVELSAAGSASGAYRVRGDEFFLRGHYPGNPVVPGVILCEIIAQASCALLGEKLNGRTPYYTGIDKVRFRRMVRPGDTVEVVVTPLRDKLGLHVVEGEARVNGELCVKGEFQFMIV